MIKLPMDRMQYANDSHGVNKTYKTLCAYIHNFVDTHNQGVSK